MEYRQKTAQKNRFSIKILEIQTIFSLGLQIETDWDRILLDNIYLYIVMYKNFMNRTKNAPCHIFAPGGMIIYTQKEAAAQRKIYISYRLKIFT